MNPEPLIYVDVIKAYKLPIPGIRPQRWRSVIQLANNHRPLFVSKHSYFNEQDAISAAWEVMASGVANVYLRQMAWQVAIQPMRLAQDSTIVREYEKPVDALPYPPGHPLPNVDKLPDDTVGK